MHTSLLLFFLRGRSKSSNIVADNSGAVSLSETVGPESAGAMEDSGTSWGAGGGPCASVA